MLIPLFHLMALENPSTAKVIYVEAVLDGNEPLTILFLYKTNYMCYKFGNSDSFAKCLKTDSIFQTGK